MTFIISKEDPRIDFEYIISTLSQQNSLEFGSTNKITEHAERLFNNYHHEAIDTCESVLDQENQLNEGEEHLGELQSEFSVTDKYVINNDKPKKRWDLPSFGLAFLLSFLSIVLIIANINTIVQWQIERNPLLALGGSRVYWTAWVPVSIGVGVDLIIALTKTEIKKKIMLLVYVIFAIFSALFLLAFVFSEGAAATDMRSTPVVSAGSIFFQQIDYVTRFVIEVCLFVIASSKVISMLSERQDGEKERNQRWFELKAEIKAVEKDIKIKKRGLKESQSFCADLRARRRAYIQRVVDEAEIMHKKMNSGASKI